ncbi:hypothetical protein [Albirhodobacter sp. R86504]|uniref:hypothetical protein n=1 Tax=Albirhodobacter sp. R86504 TaxID=3093848 RepID=UPI00366FF4E1
MDKNAPLTEAQRTPDGASDKIKKPRKAKLDRKDSQLIIRVKGTERDAFVDLCEALDTSAAREIRRFMREFILQHAEGDIATATTEMKFKEELKPDGKSKHQRAEKRS